MKKTALTMTDSERCFSESFDPDLPEDFPKSLKDENYMLKIMVEEQKIAMDMIMRKYREQADSLTKLSHVDLRKLHYQRYLNTIVNQTNKMNKMMQTMRKNLLVIFKYEELMRQLEAENERLRGLVKLLVKVSDKSKKGAELKESLEVSSQTDILSGLLVESKAVGTESLISVKSLPKPITETRCTEMVPYVSIGNMLKDPAAYYGKSPPKGQTGADLPIDEAYDVFLNRFASLSMSGGARGSESLDALVVDTDFFEDPSESCLLDVQPEERNGRAVSDGQASSTSISSRSSDEIYDDVQ